MVGIAYSFGVAIVPRGSGTSVTGGCVGEGALVVDLSGLKRVKEVDPSGLLATVEAGVVWRELNEILFPLGLHTPVAPGSGRVSTVGGAVATGGSGMRAVKYGTIREQVLGLEVVLPRGEVIRLGGKVPKTSCGYDLKDLFVGSEGTLGIITEITLKVWPKPPSVVLVKAVLPDPGEAHRIFLNLRREGILPSAFELVPRETLRLVGEEAQGGVLLCEFDGSRAETEWAGKVLEELLKGYPCEIWEGEGERESAWTWWGRIFFRLLELGPAPVAEDFGVPPSEVSSLLRSILELSEQEGIPVGLLSHQADGTIHCVICGSRDQWPDIQRLRERLYKAVLSRGGTITAEHGLGLHRSPFAPMELGPSLRIMRAIKRAIDPQGLMNPGKLFPDDGP